jgi:hypothetical protein
VLCLLIGLCCYFLVQLSQPRCFALTSIFIASPLFFQNNYIFFVCLQKNRQPCICVCMCVLSPFPIRSSSHFRMKSGVKFMMLGQPQRRTSQFLTPNQSHLTQNPEIIVTDAGKSWNFPERSRDLNKKIVYVQKNWKVCDNGALWQNIFVICFRTLSISQSQWTRGLKRGSATTRLLGLVVRIPPGAWMFVLCLL